MRQWKRSALTLLLVSFFFLSPILTEGAQGLHSSARQAESGGRSQSPHQPHVALIFDDGPSPSFTPLILDILKHEKVRATFFVIGREVAAHQEITRRIVNEGHEIENHTFSHPGREISERDLIRDLKRASAIIQKVTGKNPRYFHPSFGKGNLEEVGKRIGLKIVKPTIVPKDWERPGVEVIVKRVLSRAKNNSIILLHDGGKDRSQTVDALHLLIPQIKKGYRFVTLSEMEGARAERP